MDNGIILDNSRVSQFITILIQSFEEQVVFH